MGAIIPICAQVGSKPIRNVGSAIISTVIMNSFLRPNLSPRCPIIAPDTGRGRNPRESSAKAWKVVTASGRSGEKKELADDDSEKSEDHKLIEFEQRPQRHQREVSFLLFRKTVFRERLRYRDLAGRDLRHLSLPKIIVRYYSCDSVEMYPLRRVMTMNNSYMGLGDAWQLQGISVYGTSRRAQDESARPLSKDNRTLS